MELVVLGCFSHEMVIIRMESHSSTRKAPSWSLFYFTGASMHISFYEVVYNTRVGYDHDKMTIMDLLPDRGREVRAFLSFEPN